MLALGMLGIVGERQELLDYISRCAEDVRIKSPSRCLSQLTQWCPSDAFVPSEVSKACSHLTIALVEK